MIKKKYHLIWSGLLLAAIILPLIAQFQANFYLVHIFALVGIYIILALGLNIVVGFTGLLDLGFMAFFALGSYTSILLSVKGVPFWISLPVAIVVVVLFRIFLGWSALRLKGDYLAVVTLGFGEITRIILNNWDSLTNGPKGLPRVGEKLPAINLFGFVFTEDIHFYYLILLFVILAIVVSYHLDDSRIGRAWTAIREDEIAAELMGINVSLFKLLSFVVGSIFAGIAGAIYSHWIGFITPESFTFWESVLLLMMVVLGGMGNVAGVLLGCVLIVGIPEILRDLLGSQFILYRMLVFGSLIVVMIIFRPQGLIPSRRRSLELHPENEKIKSDEDQSLFDVK
ncbi:MAG: branched-chain amino acid ABC transporter permease [Elusimicrobiota bacterium]